MLVQLPGVRDLQHVHTLHVREPGELESDCHEVPQTVGLGKAKFWCLVITSEGSHAFCTAYPVSYPSTPRER